MDLFDKEEVTTPTVELEIQEDVAPIVVEAPAAPAAPSAPSAPAPAKPAKTGVECTRDTRGEADCDVKDCENCN